MSINICGLLHDTVLNLFQTLSMYLITGFFLLFSEVIQQNIPRKYNQYMEKNGKTNKCAVKSLTNIYI